MNWLLQQIGMSGPSSHVVGVGGFTIWGCIYGDGSTIAPFEDLPLEIKEYARSLLSGSGSGVVEQYFPPSSSRWIFMRVVEESYARVCVNEYVIGEEIAPEIPLVPGASWAIVANCYVNSAAIDMRYFDNGYTPPLVQQRIYIEQYAPLGKYAIKMPDGFTYLFNRYPGRMRGVYSIPGGVEVFRCEPPSGGGYPGGGGYVPPRTYLNPGRFTGPPGSLGSPNDDLAKAKEWLSSARYSAAQSLVKGPFLPDEALSDAQEAAQAAKLSTDKSADVAAAIAAAFPSESQVILAVAPQAVIADGSARSAINSADYSAAQNSANVGIAAAAEALSAVQAAVNRVTTQPGPEPQPQPVPQPKPTPGPIVPAPTKKEEPNTTAWIVGLSALAIGVAGAWWYVDSQEKRNPLPPYPEFEWVGKRVQLHPGMDRFMMGDRYGEVLRVFRRGGHSFARVLMDRSRRTITVRVPDQVSLV